MNRIVAIEESHLPRLLALQQPLSQAVAASAADQLAKIKAAESTWTSTFLQKAGKNLIVSLQGLMQRKVYFDWYDWTFKPGTDMLADAINQAASNSSISGILLHVDSPGGFADSAEAMATAIKNCGKPVVAFIQGMSASAAYWVTAQCAAVYTSSSQDQVGSIGTYYTHLNSVEALKKYGYDVEIIRAKASPDKISINEIEPLTDQTRKQIQTTCDQCQADFIAALAGRTIKKEATTGNIFKASQAQKLGLTDGTASLDQALSALTALYS